MPVLATVLGHPRVGLKRELKFALESFWQKKSSAEQLEATASSLRIRHLRAMKEAGVAHIPCNDFSLYDHVLDTAVMLGLIPRRYRAISDPLARYFAMARGAQDAGADTQALEMTKWVDTNYHYIVPELEPQMRARLDSTKIMRELDEARAIGLSPRPVLLGPVSFLMLCKLAPGSLHEHGALAYLESVLEAYAELLMLLHEEHVQVVQLDEPCLVLGLTSAQQQAFRDAFARLSTLTSRPSVLLATYFGELRENLELATQSGFEALHVDLASAPEQLDRVLAALPERMTLSAGLIDGRNVWRAEVIDSDAASLDLQRGP